MCFLIQSISMCQLFLEQKYGEMHAYATLHECYTQSGEETSDTTRIQSVPHTQDPTYLQSQVASMHAVTNKETIDDESNYVCRSLTLLTLHQHPSSTCHANLDLQPKDIARCLYICITRERQTINQYIMRCISSLYIPLKFQPYIHLWRRLDRQSDMQCLH